MQVNTETNLENTSWYLIKGPPNLIIPADFSKNTERTSITRPLKEHVQVYDEIFREHGLFSRNGFAKNLAMSFSRHLKTIAKLWSCEKIIGNIFKII